MKSAVVLSAIASAALTAAHGIVSELKIAGKSYEGSDPFSDPYKTPKPQKIVWSFPEAGNGPVEDVSSPAIACNKGASAAAITAPAAAGSKVTLSWTVWPESHKGPVMTYLANCGGDCTKADPTKLSYFKIDEHGLNADGTWASDDLIKDNSSWTVTIPSDIVAGKYIMRHELLALHSAGNKGGAQFYPMCANLDITGSGTATPPGVKFPGAYTAADPGILVDIYNKPTSYKIPGPAVYGSKGGNAPIDSLTPAPSAPAANPPAATAPTPTAAPVKSQAPVESYPEVPATKAPVSVPANTLIHTNVPKATPTTLLTKTRPSPTGTGTPALTPPNAPVSGCVKTSEEYNKCLDAANECIAKAQSKTGGAANFAACDQARSKCVVCA